MSKLTIDSANKELDAIQKNINLARKQLRDLQIIIPKIVKDIESGKDYDFRLLLSSESYRTKVAIELTKSNKDAAKLLNVSDRTIYRFKKNV